MLLHRLRRYAGLLAVIAALTIFFVVGLAVSIYINSTVIPADNLGVTHGADLESDFKRLGPLDEAINRQVLAHVRLIRDGGDFRSELGENFHFRKSYSQTLVESANRAEAMLLNKPGEAVAAYSAFMNIYHDHAAQHVRNVKLYEILGAMILGVGLLASLFVLLVKVSRADDQVAASLNENQSMLDAIQHGLFSVDKEFQIGALHSKATWPMFGLEQTPTGNFFDFLEAWVDKKELESAREYVALLMADKEHEGFLTKFRPLQRVKVMLDSENHEQSHRFLNFSFARSERADDPRVLVAVNDVTKEIELEEKLSDVSERSQARFHVLMGDLAADSEDLDDFFREAYGQLQQINDLLRGGQGVEIDNTRKLGWIWQRTEVIREHATKLNLALIEASASKLGENVKKLEDLPEVSNQQLLELTVDLNQISKELELIEELTGKFLAGDLSGMEEMAAKSEALTQSLQNHNLEQIVNLKNFAGKVAERHRKIINMEVYGFPDLPLRPGDMQEIQSICMQLIRNSVEHGIEDPYSRQQLNKPIAGQIVLALREMDEDKLLLTMRDDGAGLDLKNILSKAIDKGLVDKKEAKDIDPTKIVRFLFKPGFSSKESSKGGSGYGLDIVKTSVKGLGGSIGVKTQRNIFTQVSITLPRSVLEEQS